MSRSSATDRPLVIGVGHLFRRDDGVGPYVAEALAARGLEAVAHEADGAGLLDLWDGRPHCIVVDAMVGPEAGTVRRIEGDEEALRGAGFVHSSHKIGLAEAVALGRALDRLPVRLEVIGIAGRDFEFGDRLSPEVEAAARKVIAALSNGWMDLESLSP